MVLLPELRRLALVVDDTFLVMGPLLEEEEEKAAAVETAEKAAAAILLFYCFAGFVIRSGVVCVCCVCDSCHARSLFSARKTGKEGK